MNQNSEQEKQNFYLAKGPESTLHLDTELIQRAMQGDKSAFSELFMQTYRHVFLIVQSSLPREEDQYDALQSIYLRAYKGIGKLESPFAFMSWLNTIASNVCRDLRRQMEKWKKESSAADSVAEEYTEQTDIALDVREVLRQLPEEQARLLTMYYYDGLKLSEIARLTDTPASTVRSRFHAAKKALRLLFEEKQIDKNFYSKGFLNWITTSLRNAVGTNLLSVAVAQDILDSVVSADEKKKSKLEVVTAKYFLKRRNAAVLKIASVVTAISILASCLTVFVLRQGQKKPAGGQLTVTDVASEGAAGQIGSLSFDQGSSSHGTIGIPTVSDSSSRPESSWTNSSAPFASAPAGSSQTGSSSAGLSSSPHPSDPSVSASPSSSDSTSPPDGFVPDYRPEQANTVGNAANNLIQGGTCAGQGDWIYYVEDDILLYKVKMDGSGKTLILENEEPVSQLNVLGDWIYYYDASGMICRIRTDGTKKEKLKTANADCLYVIGDRLYYNHNREIYVLDLAAKSDQRVVSDLAVKSFAVQGDYLFYFTGSSDALILNFRQLSTGKTASFHEDFDSEKNWFIRGNIFYFSDSQDNIRSLNYTDSDAQSEIEVKAPRGAMYDVIILHDSAIFVAQEKNDWLYYIAFGKGGLMHRRHNLETGKEETIRWLERDAEQQDSFYDLGDGYLYKRDATTGELMRLNQDMTLSKRFS